MDQLRAGVFADELAEDAFLTARFDIPEVFITSEAKQEGQSRDLYAEPIDTNQTLRFVRDGEVVCSLRPVEAYPLGENGDPIESIEESTQIRTAQYWKLNENAPGTAEISAHLGDLGDAPYGDIAIDPSMFFSSDQDTRLEYNSHTCHGSNQNLYWYEDDHLLVGFDISAMGSDKLIRSATLQFFQKYGYVSSNIAAAIFPVMREWSEGSANWYDAAASVIWDNEGGDYTENYHSKSFILSTDDNVFVDFDVTQPFKMHYASSLSDVRYRGFLLKMLDSTNGYMKFKSKDNLTNSRRPKLRVNYAFTEMGADVGTDENIDTKLTNLEDDKMNLIRLFAHDPNIDVNINLVSRAYDYGMEVIPVFGCKPFLFLLVLMMTMMAMKTMGLIATDMQIM